MQSRCKSIRASGKSNQNGGTGAKQGIRDSFHRVDCVVFPCLVWKILQCFSNMQRQNVCLIRNNLLQVCVSQIMCCQMLVRDESYEAAPLSAHQIATSSKNETQIPRTRGCPSVEGKNESRRDGNGRFRMERRVFPFSFFSL